MKAPEFGNQTLCGNGIALENTGGSQIFANSAVALSSLKNQICFVPGIHMPGFETSQ